MKSKVSLFSTANKQEDAIIDVGDSVSQVGSIRGGGNKSTLNIMNKYVKNVPRNTYDESEPKVNKISLTFLASLSHGSWWFF